MKGKYIVFEGIDGSGKSTACTNLANALVSNGYKVLLISEPSQSKIGQLLREQMGHLEVDQKTLALLFAADSYNIQNDFSDNYDFILSDRNFFSTVAYQMVEVNTEWLFMLHKYLKKPDIIFYLNVEVNEALERISLRDRKKEVFESKEALYKVQKNYEKIIQNRPDYNIIQIQTSQQSLGDVEKKIFNTLRSRYNISMKVGSNS